MKRGTIREALERGHHYPSFIRVRGEVDDDVPPLALAQAYARSLSEAGLGEIVAYSVRGMGGETTHGTQADLEDTIRARGSDPVEAGYIAMVTRDATHLSFSRGQGGRPAWAVEAAYPSETIPTVEWLEAMTKLIIASASIPGFKYAELQRQTDLMGFVPEPPLACHNHVTTVTDAEVADAYNDPSSLPHNWNASFFDLWDRVERVGDKRICIRALDALEVQAWLAATFENTMHLARLAKPKKTRYLPPGEVGPAFAAWWQYGDLIADEKAGYPALANTGYDPATRTLEFAGFVTDTPVERGGPDPRHVLIREIHTMRAVVRAKRTIDGQPVDTVRIVFPDEWMARRERRPLLDAGARVYFMGRPSGDLVEVTD
jgi:hypothetical protein